MATVPVPRLKNFIQKQSQPEPKQNTTPLSPTLQSAIPPQPPTSSTAQTQAINASQITLIGSLRAQVSFLAKQSSQPASQVELDIFKAKLEISQSRERSAIDRVTALERDSLLRCEAISQAQAQNIQLHKEHDQVLAENQYLKHRYFVLKSLAQKLARANQTDLGKLYSQVSENELSCLAQLLGSDADTLSLSTPSADLCASTPQLTTPPPTPHPDDIPFPQKSSSWDSSVLQIGEPPSDTPPLPSHDALDMGSGAKPSSLTLSRHKRRLTESPCHALKKRRMSDSTLNLSASSHTACSRPPQSSTPTHLTPSLPEALSLLEISSQEHKRPAKIRTCRKCCSNQCPGRFRRHMCEGMCWRCGHKDCDSLIRGLQECDASP